MLPRYTVEVSHNGLGKYRVVSGTDYYAVQAKAKALQLSWDEEHRRKQAKEREKNAKEQERKSRIRSKEERQQEVEEKLDEANERTDEAKAALEQIQNTLHYALGLKNAVKWEKLKRTDPYPTPEPVAPNYLEYPNEPKREDVKYQLPPNSIPEPNPERYKPNLSIWDKLFKSRANKKVQAVNELYAIHRAAWVEKVQQTELQNKQRMDELFLHDHAGWEESVPKVQLENQRRYDASVAAINQWNVGRLEYEQTLAKENEALERLKADYEALKPEAITDYCEIVLSASKYPDNFPQDFNLEYIAETKILVIDYSLPAPEHLPKLKEIKYIKTKDEFAETSLSETESNRIYSDLLYQICLRTIYELFDADVVGASSAIVFNGWVKSIDKATGKKTNGCLLSVQAKKEEYQDINLRNVDPKVCFKALKGIGSSQLHSLTPIAPVLNISREDKRFIASREVENQIDERFNLAAMDWEDFEQLVREIFEKEFREYVLNANLPFSGEILVDSVILVHQREIIGV